MEDAISAYVDFERYHITPNGGGMQDQPYSWKQQMDCIYSAKEQAEWEREIERDR